MNIFKRVWLSVGSSVDSFAGKLENQEAVAEGIIREMEEAVISVRSEVIKVKNEIVRLEKGLAEQEKAKETWSDRAKRSAENDREKAIQCVRFVKQADDRIVDIKNELVETRRVERELTVNLSEGEQRLNELRRKKRILASRQARADVTNYAKNTGNGIGSDADELFSRWEAKVGRSEGLNENSSTEADLMAMEFTNEEEQQELSELLDTIVNEKESN